MKPMSRFLLPYGKAKMYLQDDKRKRTFRVTSSETGLPSHDVRLVILTSTESHCLFLFAAATSLVVHSHRFLEKSLSHGKKEDAVVNGRYDTHALGLEQSEA